VSTSTTSSVSLSHKNAAFAEEEQKAFLRGSPAGSSGNTRKQKMILGSRVKILWSVKVKTMKKTKKNKKKRRRRKKKMKKKRRACFRAL